MLSSVHDTIFSALVAFGVTGLAIDAVVGIAPNPITESAFEVRSITGERVGDTAVLDVDRVVHMPIVMGFSVRILEVTESGLEQYCIMDAEPFPYSPNAVVPDTIDLDWWTNGECATLPDGPVVVDTTWTPRKEGYAPVTYRFSIPSSDGV